MNLNKDPSSWANVEPELVLAGSRAQQINVLTMALEDIAKLGAEVERLRTILTEAHNFWRHDFRDEVETAAERLFKKFAASNTDPFADRRERSVRSRVMPSQNGTK